MYDDQLKQVENKCRFPYPLRFFLLSPSLCLAMQLSEKQKMISNFRSNNNLTREKLIMLSSFRWVKVLQCIRKTKASFLYEKQDLETQEWGF